MKEMGVLTRPAWLRDFAGIGYTGVSFFFVLSGFILSLHLLGPHHHSA
jgi:peptidoglycan/LPS O-acetylase OafA/YrhL